ncbi:hypothetical protein MES5069_220124 [Mesorhizobium escarrei]|uniref:Uncharacterized protein n=1 Tax=Mesorhizobium escarrei TaxID=666018 RepID=A0ABN8JMR7_9HYPH|nr:hypothetical protein MES5069_220124 [Mesorhizobium escarrei]
MFGRTPAPNVPEANYRESNGERVCDPVGYPTLRETWRPLHVAVLSGRWTKSSSAPEKLHVGRATAGLPMGGHPLMFGRSAASNVATS